MTRAFIVTVDGELMRAQEARERREKAAYTFAAPTWDEARAIHALRTGKRFDPGPPANCPQCGATVYPEASGECWVCHGQKHPTHWRPDSRSFSGTDYHEAVDRASEPELTPLFDGG